MDTSDNKYEFSCDRANKDYIFDYVGQDRLSYGGAVYLERGVYETQVLNGLNYIQFKSNNGFELRKKLGFFVLKRQLFLFDGDRLFYRPKISEYFDLNSKDVFITSVKSSSFLKEGITSYDGTFFIPEGDNKLLPWVEGKEDEGIDEWIEFKVKNTTETCGIEGLALLNGYISFVNPTLFDKNNRIKEFELTCLDNGYTLKGVLDDTKNMQTIAFANPLYGKELTFRLKIKSVYRGNKYNDTCLSYIFPLSTLPKKGIEKY